MSEQTESTSQSAGAIGDLPPRWRTAVHLISTFGLAVFLVLYYLFWMRPEDNARYERLRASVDGMTKIIKEESAALSESQASQLESLYIEAVAPEVVQILMDTEQPEDATAKVEESLLLKADKLHGFARENGRTLTETLANRVRPVLAEDRRVAPLLVQELRKLGPDVNRKDLIAHCQRRLEDLFHARQMAK